MNGITKASDRIAARKKAPIKIALFGESGVGKTTQARTLPPETTLFIDLEAGDLATGEWQGDSFDVRDFAAKLGAHPWEICRAIALYLGGPDPADADGPYSQAMYDEIVKVFGDPKGISHIETVFLDSITKASRWCLAWAKIQPEAFSEKTGKPDTRGAYGLLGQEMVRWLTHLQYVKKSIVIVGILDRFEDDLKRVEYSPQIEGSKSARDLPGIFDLIVSMDYLLDDRGKPVLGADGNKQRAFYTQRNNPHGFPAKDRSGCLDAVEPPDLNALLAKARSGKRKDSAIVTTLPAPEATPAKA